MSKLVDLTNKTLFPLYNIDVYPEGDGVRFARDLRKELENGGVLSVRKVLIAKFVQLGKTATHAGNYWDKTNKLLRGENPHSTNIKWAAKQSKNPAPVIIPEQITKVDDVVTVTTTVYNRWLVVNKDTSQIIDSFTSREVAKKHNADLRASGANTRWADNAKEHIV